MLASELNFGVPDLDLNWTCGGTVNPSCFVGHPLVVLFLPVAMEEAVAELESFDAVSEEFFGLDAWCLVVARKKLSGSAHSGPIALDANDSAWTRFTRLAKIETARERGGIFLFTRGGALHRVWQGRGHAREVLAELQTGD